jgi:hypothetical protein
VRLLELPRIRDAGGRPASAAPGPDLLVAWMLAVLLDVLLNLILQGALAQLPFLGETALPSFLAWYVANFTALTLIGSAIATLLVRRARHAAAG